MWGKKGEVEEGRSRVGRGEERGRREGLGMWGKKGEAEKRSKHKG